MIAKEVPKVEYGIPIPPVVRSKTSLLIPVVAGMKVNGSLPAKTHARLNYLRSIMRKQGFKSTTRRHKDGTFHIWRTK